MALTPGYGETPIDHDEFDALIPEAREALGEPITKAAVYDLEQAVQEDLAEELLACVLDGSLPLDNLLVDHSVRELHRRLYGDIWVWAGVFRNRELNLGVAPEQIAIELCGSLGTIRYRWEHSKDWTPRELGIAVHSDTAELYDWQLDKHRYIALLRQHDVHRDPRDLAAFVGTAPLGQ